MWPHPLYWCLLTTLAQDKPYHEKPIFRDCCNHKGRCTLFRPYLTAGISSSSFVGVSTRQSAVSSLSKGLSSTLNFHESICTDGTWVREVTSYWPVCLHPRSMCTCWYFLPPPPPPGWQSILLKSGRKTSRSYWLSIYCQQNKLLLPQVSKWHKVSFLFPSLSDSSSLQKRTFNTFEFYRKYQDMLTPAGLRFFQCRWDESVQGIFHNILSKLLRFG